MASRRGQEAFCWKLDGTTARLACGPLTGEIDLAAADGGVGALQFEGAPLPGWLMGVSACVASEEPNAVEAVIDSGPPSDAFVRGRDLIAVYRESADRPFTVQVYWRAGRLTAAAPGRHSAMLDAIVSIQTRQWEAFPAVRVDSALPADEAHLVPMIREPDERTDVAVLFRLPGGAWSYGETPHEGDFKMRSVGAEIDGVRQTTWRFGGHFMERGVIRRLRLRGAFLSQRDDFQTLQRLQAALAVESPPLTA